MLPALPASGRSPFNNDRNSRFNTVGLGQMRSFSVQTPSKTTKKGHIWPRPRFSGPEPGFGPDVVVLGCFGMGLHQQ